MSGLSYDYCFNSDYYMQILPVGLCRKCKSERELFDYKDELICCYCLCNLTRENKNE